jgi:hypothetical protein
VQRLNLPSKLIITIQLFQGHEHALKITKVVMLQSKACCKSSRLPICVIIKKVAFLAVDLHRLALDHLSVLALLAGELHERG